MLAVVLFLRKFLLSAATRILFKTSAKCTAAVAIALYINRRYILNDLFSIIEHFIV